MTPGGSIRNRPCRSEALIAIGTRSDPKGLRDGAQLGRRSEQTNFERDRPLRLIAHRHEIAAIEFGHDKRLRQPGHAPTAQGHDFQHPRVMGSEDRAGAGHRRRRREVVRKNAAKTRVLAVGDEGVGRRIPSALLNGGDYPWSGDRHEGVAPDQHGGEHRGVKPNGRRRMAMGEHELSSSFPHQPLATSEAFRSELDGSKPEFPPIAAIHSEKKVSDSECVAAMRSGSTGAGNAARASVRASSTWRRSVSAQGNNRRPASVSVTARGPRSNSGPPVHCSSARIRRLKAGCVMWRRAAAREKLPLSVRATKSASQFKSKPVQVHVVLGIGR